MKLQCRKKLGILSLAFFISISFNGCEDKSYFKQVYNTKLLNKYHDCLQLKLEPYNHEIYLNTKDIYNFTQKCDRILKIRYKTDIGCNSPYKTGNFNSFIELNLVQNNKTYFTIYKDLKDENINDEINKAFEYLQNQINLKRQKNYE